MLRAKARERSAKGLFLGEGILDSPQISDNKIFNDIDLDFPFILESRL